MDRRMLKRRADLVPPAVVMKDYFKGRCACGAKIKTGDNIFFDRHLTRIVKCKRCGASEAKLAAAGLTLQNKISAVQMIIDRIKQIKMLPRPLSLGAETELEDLILKLKDGKSLETTEAIRFVIGLARRRFPTADFFIGHVDEVVSCALCGNQPLVGAKVLIARSISEIVCLACPLRFEDIY